MAISYSTSEYHITFSSYELFYRTAYLISTAISNSNPLRIQFTRSSYSEVQESLLPPNATFRTSQPQLQCQVSNPIALDPAISPPSITSMIQPIDLVSDSPPPRQQ